MRAQYKHGSGSLLPLRATIPAAAVMAVFAASALLKLSDLNIFRNAMETWTLLPHGIRSALVIGVPVAELAIAGLWFAGIARRKIRGASLVFLLGITGAYLAQAVFVKIPDCGCFGLIAQAEAGRQDALFLVVRNACLLGLLGVSWLADGLARRRAGGTGAPRGAPAAAPGFTLLEVVIVIAIVGLLVALLMPSLGRARFAAERLTVRSSLGQHARVVAAYISDWDDAYPIYADADADIHIIRSQNRTLTYKRYFDIVSGWHVALADGYYGSRSDGDDFQRRGVPAYAVITPYFYSPAFLAQPAFWNEMTRTGPDQWRGVRDAQVQWPSAKVLFLDSVMWDQTARPADPNYSSERNTDVSLLDGSARRVTRSEFEPPYPGGEGTWPGSRYDFGEPGLHTRDGVAGRDIR